MGPLLRLGTGALAAGYKAEWVADDGSDTSSYSLARVGGRRLKESSKAGRCVCTVQHMPQQRGPASVPCTVC